MSNITITINTDNAAFGETEDDVNREVARILREVADRAVYAPTEFDAHPIRDANGNAVGSIQIDF